MRDLDDTIRELESQRDEALSIQDAPNYYRVCELLGLSMDSVADPTLYELGMANANSGFGEFHDVEFPIKRNYFPKDSLDSGEGIEEVDDDWRNELDWNALAEIALPDFRVKHPKFVKQRLRELRRLGYEVPNYGELRKDSLFELYRTIKDDIYENSEPRIRARITAENSESRERNRLFR